MNDDDVKKIRSALFFPFLLPIVYRNKENSLTLRLEAAKALNSLLTFFIIFFPATGISIGLAILLDDLGGSFIFLAMSMLFIYWVITITLIRLNRRSLKKGQPTSYLPSFSICEAKP